MDHSFESAEAGSRNNAGQLAGFDYLVDGYNQKYSPTDSAQSYLGQLEISGSASSLPSDGYSNRTGPLPVTELKEVSDLVFNRIDANNDGLLDLRELAASAQDGSFKGQEAQAVAALYGNFFHLHKLSDDESVEPEDGSISGDDLEKFDSLAPGRQELNDAYLGALGWLWDDRFLTFDADGNERLSKSEIDGALENENVSEQDRAVLTYLKENTGTVVHTHNDGEGDFQTKEISYENFSQHALNEMDYLERVMLGSESVIERTVASQAPSISRELFGDKQHPEESVTPEAISRGFVNNSNFLASLAAVANTQPELIVNMIKDNGNGTYTVTFPSAPDHSVTVAEPTDMELGLFNGGSEHGTWATVVEKAYGRLVSEMEGRDSRTDVEGAGSDVSSSMALNTLTGNSFAQMEVDTAQTEDLIKALEASFSANPPRPVTAVTPQLEDPETDGGLTINLFVKNQTYTVTDFNPDGNGGGDIVIRGSDGGDFAIHEISLEKFQRNFDHIVHQHWGTT